MTGIRWVIRAAVVIGVFGCQAEAQIQKASGAGHWYPAEREALERALTESFETAEKRASGIPRRKSIRALVAPHAGLQYSGIVAASAYRLLGQPKNIILLGLSHRRRVDGVVGIDVKAYATPLGRVEVNREILDELGFSTKKEDVYADHSLENQLPFVSRAAPAAKIVPLYVGDLEGEELAAAARKLATRVRKGDVLIASSDFTHYGKSYGYQPFPLDEKTRNRLYKQAMVSFEEIGTLDGRLFSQYLRSTRDTICGRQPVRLLIETLAQLPEESWLHLADFMTSGDLTRDYTASVSYGALAFYPSSAFQVDSTDGKKLLQSARSTLERFLSDSSKTGVPVPEEERSADVRQHGGVFVTVKRGGKLRGCVGTFAATKPLWDAVPDRTLAASSADPRFTPLSENDGPVTLEISLLTPVKRLSSWEQFRLGRGAVLLLNGKSGTLLPQVALEMGWNETEFLENLAKKAGLQPHAYKSPDARLYVYEAQVFSETEPTNGPEPAPRTGQ